MSCGSTYNKSGTPGIININVLHGDKTASIFNFKDANGTPNNWPTPLHLVINSPKGVIALTQGAGISIATDVLILDWEFFIDKLSVGQYEYSLRVIDGEEILKGIINVK